MKRSIDTHPHSGKFLLCIGIPAALFLALALTPKPNTSEVSSVSSALVVPANNNNELIPSIPPTPVVEPTPIPIEPIKALVDSGNRTLERNALIIYANTPDGIRRISNPITGRDFVTGQEFKELIDPNNPNNICKTEGATLARYLTFDQIADINQQFHYPSYRAQILQTADQLAYNYFNQTGNPANIKLIRSELSFDNATDCTQELNQDLRRGINVNSREYLHIDNYSEKDKTR